MFLARMRSSPRAAALVAGVAAVLVLGVLIASQATAPGPTGAPSSAPSPAVSTSPAASVATPTAAPPASAGASTAPVLPPGATAPGATSRPVTPLPTAVATVRPGLSGLWTGTWEVTAPAALSGDLVLTLDETGGFIEGLISTGDTTCIESGAVFGNAVGNDFTFTVTQREVSIAFVGSRSGGTLSGTFTTQGCDYAEGTWSVSRG